MQASSSNETPKLTDLHQSPHSCDASANIVSSQTTPTRSSSAGYVMYIYIYELCLVVRLVDAESVHTTTILHRIIHYVVFSRLHGRKRNVNALMQIETNFGKPRMTEMINELCDMHFYYYRRSNDGKWSFNPDPMLYSLPELYKQLIGEEMNKSHRAESDCFALMRICLAYGIDFIKYVDDNARLFPRYIVPNTIWSREQHFSQL